MKKLIFSILPAFLLTLVSCMNMNSSNGKEGAIRITVPGEERGLYTFNKSNASSYKVSIILDKEVIDSQIAELGGVITFDELEPATYTVKAEAFDSDGIRIGSGSIEVKVVAGETAEKTILMILTNGGEIYETNYLLFYYNSNTNKYYYADSTSEINDQIITGNNSVIAGYTEDKNGAVYQYFKSNNTADGGGMTISDYTSIQKTNGDQTYFKITYQDDTPVIDPFYYDETTDALWIGHYATTNNTLKFLKIENPSTKFSSIQDYPTFATSTGFSVSGATYTAFAIQGSDIYIAYTNSGTSYLQRGTITGSNDSGFSITAKGTAQSTKQMGVAGTINDIAILYDGYVYVLVSDIEKLTDHDHTINDGDTVKSRGAILKILGTDSGFEVENILGWTNSARTISSKLNNDSNNLYNNIDKIYQINSIKAYIPKLSESSKKFYGAERFVAIKPKELAIADCGANIILPDYKNKKNGNMFQHDRVVTVNLYDFAITNVTELNNLDFKRLSISGVISYIYTFTSSYSSDEE